MERNIQYWKNGLMFKLVTPQEKEEIIKQAVKDGYEVFDNITYFSVEAKRK
jgi:hypothetical protein